MISVIIPAYNAEKTIKDCLNALLKQCKDRNEIIIVDDGSKDNTIKIIKQFRNVKLFRQKHKGPATARNLGAKNAKGDILLFTDSDCVVDKNWISEMVKPFKNPEIIGVQGKYETKQNGLVPRFVQLEIEDRYERMKKRKYVDFIGSYSAGYRRNIFIESKGFDESFPEASGEDPELSFKLAGKGYKLVFNPKAIVYHQHPSTLKKYLKQKFWRAYWRVLLYKKYPQKIKTESYTPQNLKFQIILFYLFVLSSIYLIVNISLFYIPLALFLLLIVSTFHLSYKNSKTSLNFGLISPIILILRTIVFGFGLFYGFLKLILK